MDYCYLETPIGELLLAGDDEGLSLIGFPEGKMPRAPETGWTYSERPFSASRRQLTEYFAGERDSFELPMRPSVTAFQRRVYEELARIPYGTTISYGELAARIGRPKAVRAVGAANGRNAIPIVIPCHRVIGSDGQLTGFGGGLSTKRALLELEFANRGFELELSPGDEAATVS